MSAREGPSFWPRVAVHARAAVNCPEALLASPRLASLLSSRRRQRPRCVSRSMPPHQPAVVWRVDELRARQASAVEKHGGGGEGARARTHPENRTNAERGGTHRPSSPNPALFLSSFPQRCLANNLIHTHTHTHKHDLVRRQKRPQSKSCMHVAEQAMNG